MLYKRLDSSLFWACIQSTIVSSININTQLIWWLIHTVGVAFYLSCRGSATCSFGSYWNKAYDSFAGRGSDLHRQQFRLFRDIELCPGNTFSMANVVGSPRSYPFLAVAKVADIADFLPLETLKDGALGQLHAFTLTPRTPLEDSIASSICSAVSKSCIEFRYFAMCDFTKAALLSQAPFPPYGSKKSIREMWRPCVWQSEEL